MKKRLSVILTVGSTLLLLGGCGNAAAAAGSGSGANADTGTNSGADTGAATNSDSSVTTETTEASESGDIVLRAATQTDYPPFCFIDENDKLTGFDYELLEIIDERLPVSQVDSSRGSLLQEPLKKKYGRWADRNS